MAKVPTLPRLRRVTLEFLKTETAGGVVLGLAALAGLVAANSPWRTLYEAWLARPASIQVGAWSETLSIADWVKEGLMAGFFFVLGLEIKFEILRGELSSPRRLALPVLGALGGMIVPALVYLMINLGPGGRPEGWPTPVATDIAFALAVLALVGRGLPTSLRTFLMALAVADDLGAVVLIGALFTRHTNEAALLGAFLSLGCMALLARWRQAPVSFFVAGAVAVWAFTLHSGVSTSVAGVAAAMTVPISPRKPGQPGLLETLAEGLNPYVAFGVLPLFAFTASGLTFDRLSGEGALSPVSVGVALGLLLGKPLGVFGACALAVRLGLARRPTGASWAELAGVACLCGVGFTMSLFLGALAFPARDDGLDAVKLGVLAGSLGSALAGLAVLSAVRRAPRLRAA